jgi:hypothetical protein
MDAEHRRDSHRAMRRRGTLQIGLCVWCTALLLATPAAAPGRGYPVTVYFSKHPTSDENPTAVFPVWRLSPTRAVATFAIGQLLVGPTRAEARSGYYTALAGIFQRLQRRPASTAAQLRGHSPTRHGRAGQPSAVSVQQATSAARQGMAGKTWRRGTAASRGVPPVLVQGCRVAALACQGHPQADRGPLVQGALARSSYRLASDPTASRRRSTSAGRLMLRSRVTRAGSPHIVPYARVLDTELARPSQT